MQLRTEIEIDAPPSRVWEVLVRFAEYPDWNPHLKSVNGELTVGAAARPSGEGVFFVCFAMCLGSRKPFGRQCDGAAAAGVLLPMIQAERRMNPPLKGCSGVRR